MISLNIEKYCHDCPDFEPTVNKIFSEFDDSLVVGVVECEYRSRCKQIARHIEKEMKKEKE